MFYSLVRRPLSVAVSLLVLLFVASKAQATDIQVPSQYASIQEGINAAVDGDRVLVAPGIYKGNANVNLDFQGKNIAVIGVSGRKACIIECNGNSRALNFHSGESPLALFKGFTIQHGMASQGGAIHIDGASPTITNTAFEYCHSDNGGAIWINNGSPLIRVSEFTSNAATYGGAIAVVGGNPSILTVTFSHNTASANGGAVALSAGYLDVHRSNFLENAADGNGGAFYQIGGTLTLAETHVQENSALDGAGLYFGAASSANLLNCSISVNRALLSFGGMSLQAGANVSMANTIVTHNIPGQVSAGVQSTTSFVDGGYGGQSVDQMPTFQDLALMDAHLRYSSGVDAGSRPKISLEAVDLDGNSRVSGQAPDLGAYEHTDSNINTPDTITVSIPHDGDPATCTYDVNLTGTASNPMGTPMTYEWLLDGSSIGAAQTLHMSLKAGEYNFQFKATDSLGQYQVRQTTVVVNPEPNGAPKATAEVVSTSRADGGLVNVTIQATASDPDFDNLTSQWSDGETSLSRTLSLPPGNYEYTVLATDPYGAVGTAKVHFSIDQETGAVISVLGANPMQVEVNSTFVDPGAVAYDAGSNRSLDVRATGSVDTHMLGTYQISYGADSLAGLHATASRSVIVADTQPPVITLNGSASMVIGYGTTFTDPGATAVDSYVGNVPVTVTSSVDTLHRGTYTVTYKATDPSGNSSTKTRSVKVVVQTAPTVTLNGANPYLLQVGTTWFDPGATAVSAIGDVLGVTITGSVDSITDGNYTLTYTATDADGNVGSTTRVVKVADRIPPVITVLGSNPLTMKVAPAAYSDAGATALDAVDGPVGVSISGGVNSHVVGTYTVSYFATDSSGNSANVSRTVNVVKPDGPVITVIGANPVSIPGGTTYTDAGATAVDALGTSVTVTTTSNVNMMKLGTYTVTYSATDQWGTTSTATRTVTVTAPTTPPTITLLGVNPVIIEKKDTYAESGATAVDALGNTLTVVITGSVPTHTVGTFILTYTATDQWGNTASVTRTVQVVNAFLVITILGANPMNVQWGTTFVDPGSTCVDANGISLSLKNEFGSVNTNVLGTYTLTYSYQDSHGNKLSADRTVNVVNTLPPTITLNGSDPMAVTFGSTFTDPGATAKDALGATVTVVATGTVNTATAGSYTRTYTATDSYGNVGTKTRTVTITAPTVPPTVTLVGANPLITKKGALFSDPGATAKDSLGNTLTVTATGTVNPGTAGAYTRTYSATDQWGNTASITRTVKVYGPPVITLSGGNPQILVHSNGTTWTDPGYSCVDSFGVSLAVTVTGGGFKEKVGSYTVTYTATDAAGNTTTVTRTVTCT